MEEAFYWAHLASLAELTPDAFDLLLQYFGSITGAFRATPGEISAIPGLKDSAIAVLNRARETLESSVKGFLHLRAQGCRFISRLDEDYPPRFLDADPPPLVIYQFGEMQEQDSHSVAIIGSRDCTEASARRAQEYAWILVQHGLTVVSGYADGIDIKGHCGALAGGGRTIIIPGCGVNHFDFTPLRYLGITMFADFEKKSVLISEQTPDAPWSSQGCLARNRLVAAQAKALLVIEARTGSSTLNTVSRAQKLGRPIFVQISKKPFDRFSGNEFLRRGGAGIIRDVGDLERIVEVVKN